MAFDFDYRLTQYQPSYTYGGDRYETDQPVSPAKSPVLAKMDQEAREAAQARVYKRQAGDPSTFLPNYLAQGLIEDVAEMKSLASNGKRQEAQGIRDKISGYADQYRSALVAWTQNGELGGKFGEDMAKQAEAVLYGKYLDDNSIATPTGQGTMTLRDYFAISSPEAKAAAAETIAKEYGVSLDAATILSDQQNPFYFVFSDMLRDYASGVELQTRQATRLGGESKAAQAQSAMRLYSEHLINNREQWGEVDPKVVTDFYKQAYRYFGGDLASSQVDTLMRQYQRDMQGPTFSSSRWFQSRKSALDRNMPKDTLLVPDPKNPGKVQAIQVNAPDIDGYQVLDTSLAVSDMLNGQNVQASTDVIESAVGKRIAKAHELETELGIKLADYGLSNAVAAAAAAGLDSTFTTSDGSHKALDQLSNVVDRARMAFGYTNGVSTSSGVRLGDLEKAIVKAVGKSYLSFRPDLVDGMWADGEGRLSPGFVQRAQNDIVSALDDYASEKGLPIDWSLAQEMAGRFIESMATGQSQNLQTMLLDIGGRLAQNPRTGAVELTPPTPYVDPRTGRETEGNINPTDVDPGLLGTDSSKVASLNAAGGVEMFRARQSLAELADGKAAHLAGRSEASAVRKMAAYTRKVQDDMLAGRLVSTEGMEPAAGAVLLSNLQAAGVQLGREASGFFNDGGFLRFTVGRDKSTGITDGDPGLRQQATQVVNELADAIIEGRLSPESGQCAAEMFSRLTAELLNRGGWEDSANGRDVGYFSEKARNLLTSLGIVEATEFWEKGTLRGRPGQYRRIPHGDVSDARAREIATQLNAALGNRMGYATNTDGMLKRAGFIDPELGVKPPSANVNYGRILSVWDARTRPEPPLNEVPVASSDASASVDSTEVDPRAALRRAADGLLRSTLSRDEGLNAIGKDLTTRINARVQDKNLAAALQANAMMELERKYDQDGWAAAYDWARSQMQRQELYTVDTRPVFDKDGKPEYNPDGTPKVNKVVKVGTYTLDQINEILQTNPGLSILDILQNSARLQKDYARQLTLADKFGLIDYEARVKAMTKPSE